MRSLGKFIIVTLAMASIISCGRLQTNQAFRNVNEGSIDKTARPACEIKTSEYALDTKVVAFEITSQTGISMGFDLISKFLKLFQLSFRTKTGRMQLAMSLYDPLKPQYELMNVLGQSKLNEREFSFDIDYKQIHLGFDTYYKTPLSLLTEKGLHDTFKNLDNAIAGLEDEWTTNVVAVPSEYEVVVPVGSFTGLKIGDQFEIYNVEHIWEGEPCKSEHLIARKTTSFPVAIGAVTQIDKNAAVLMLQRSPMAGPSDSVEVGAVVEVQKLQGEKRRLFRTLEIHSVDGAEMDFDNGRKVDLTPYVKDQIRALAHQHGFVIYQPK